VRRLECLRWEEAALHRWVVEEEEVCPVDYQSWLLRQAKPWVDLVEQALHFQVE
jgi:hypothetical protein